MPQAANAVLNRKLPVHPLFASPYKVMFSPIFSLILRISTFTDGEGWWKMSGMAHYCSKELNLAEQLHPHSTIFIAIWYDQCN
jgi:hypothetical protein